MGKLWLGPLVVLGFAASACQPLYGGPAEVKHVPAPKAHPETEAAVQKIVYIDECELHTRVLHAPAVRDQARSNEMLLRAETTQQSANKETEPRAKGDLVTDSVREFGQALEKDPYSAEATLKLALAYDRVWRKGCALALLGRLAQLSKHPTFQKDADAQIDDVESNRTWFKGYRQDALKAVGRP
jgi:hypothetical protein